MAKGSDNSFGIIAVIFGILSLIFSISMIPFPGVIIGVIGLIFALIQKKKSNNKWVNWGMILSILGIVLGVILLIFFISTLVEFAQQVQELQASGALNSMQGAV